MGGNNSQYKADAQAAIDQNDNTSNEPEELDLPAEPISPQPCEQEAPQQPQEPSEDKQQTREPAVDLDISPPETTENAARAANRPGFWPAENEAEEAVAAQSKSPNNQEESKYDEIGQDPTLNYFESLQTAEPVAKPKVTEFVASDDLDGFDLEKFRNANCGGKEVKEDMVFAKW